MCGIIAVLRRRARRTPPDPSNVLELLDGASSSLAALGADPAGWGIGLEQAATALDEADALLGGVPGVQAVLGAPHLGVAADRLLDDIGANVARLDAALDVISSLSTAALEATNAALVRVKDRCWALQCDRLRTARAVGGLAGPHPTPSAIEAYTSIQVALAGLDRLEVRGRDSAGLHVLVHGHDLDLDSGPIRALLGARTADKLFRSMGVRVPDGYLSFVYKAAAEIGELGDNTRALRAAIAGDELLRLAVSAPGAEAAVVGHTRWASVGIISQANAHPLNSDEEVNAYGLAPYVVGALNGDVDNFADLKATEGLQIAADITTDAKVIPTLVSHRLAGGDPPAEAFRRSVAGFEGSVAICAQAAAAPSQLLLALRGSGQALYVGFGEDSYVVASEPYGLVEETSRYMRMDGETPARPERSSASRGQIVVLDGEHAGDADGVVRLAYDGTPLPVTAADVHTAEITTRDIDRGDFPHYLIKEIGEAPLSFRKTLRGKLVDVDGDGGLAVNLGSEALPDEVRAALRDRRITRVVAIGQGTAAVAAQAMAGVLSELTADTPLRVEGMLATELSGFGVRTDMGDTLVVAISQSGTTTDTNRTVDVVRARGAAVVAIVNRRQSDLTDKADGVLYTSDGRDVEMSVPSTKAFYAQIAAGVILAAAVAEAAGAADAGRTELLAALRTVPDAMARTVALRPEIASIARELAPSRRYWAVVGNGLNRIAAAELRIKLSELCYKSIAFDATEDKKHIDLSAEPLILVCAAGLSGSNADDVAKEVAIFRAHKAAPVVIATEGEERFSAALARITVPATHPKLAFVLSAMAGHLFGYEAALAIDAQAHPLREARAAIEHVISALPSTDGPTGLPDGDVLLRQLRPSLQPVAARFFDGLRAGEYDGHLEASTAVRLASLFRYALGVTSFDSYQFEYGKVGTPAVVIDDLLGGLTEAIEALTRPIDAIKHQAKTVTVGISRADETLLSVPLVRAVVDAGAPRDRLTYKTLRTLAALDPAITHVTGWTRYEVGPSSDAGEVPVVVVDRGGIARDIPSRTEHTGVLRGTKHTVAIEKQVFVTRGRDDGRPIVIVPEMKDNQTTGITLLHVRFADRVSSGLARSVLEGYRNRLAPLVDAVAETEPTFRDDLLAETPIEDLLVLPIRDLADRWRV